MPCTCIVVGCNNNGGKDGHKLYMFPVVRKHEGKAVEELTERRLRLWIKAVNRKTITATTVKRHHRICSEHFVKGKPAYLHLQTDPDWIPTINMGYGKESTRPVEVHARLQERKKRKCDMEAAHSLLDLSVPSQVENELSDPEPEVEQDYSTSTQQSKATETDITSQDIINYQTCINNMSNEIVELKAKVHKNSFQEEMFQDNDENVKYYTGLPTWLHLFHLITFLLPVMSRREGKNALSAFQEIILVLIKLRLGLSNKIIGDFFHIDKSTVSRVFLRVLNVMYHNMKFLICWPDRDSLKQTMPLEFVKYFGRKVAVIIDCFEIFIERPSNIKARAQTYSNYKSHNTVKYLIGITPQGSISFISEGWGGRTSDKHIVEHSDFLSNLELGDIVLADRGFDIHDSVNMMCAELKIPAFTRGKKQLSPFEVESTRKLAHLRIHVERVIGNMNIKYTILNSEMPVDYVLTDDQATTTLDQIVIVCACLINICPSVVPFS